MQFSATTVIPAHVIPVTDGTEKTQTTNHMYTSASHT